MQTSAENYAAKALQAGHIPVDWGGNHYRLGDRVYASKAIIAALTKEMERLRKCLTSS